MIEAIIFDMDGVISDTQKLHSKIESMLLKRYGIEITPEQITRKYSGVRTQDFFEKLLEQQEQEYNLEKLMQEKWTRMRNLASISVDPISGSSNLIKTLKENRYKLAVASASNSDYVQAVLKTLKIQNYFNCVVTGDMVSCGKPDPESFLLAASKINTKPENCLVIEDGISGMTAAKRANMKCIGLVENKKGEYPTDYLVTSLSEITPKYIRKNF